MYIVGKIDKNIYKNIIQRRGQEFYDKYGAYFGEIIENPDYIFADKEHTLLVCEKFLKDQKYVNLALRVVVSTDSAEYKNSIVIAVGENEKRFKQRLRNNQPLY